MLLPAFNIEELTIRLEKMNNWQKLAFGAVCCERLLPNYLAFQNEIAWGDFGSIRGALNLAWLTLEGQTPNHDEIKKAISSCEFVAPNSEDFESLLVTLAQDACFAVCSLLDYLLEKNASKIAQVARYATDSVDLYVQEIQNLKPNDPDLEKKILTHILMQRELKRQKEDLESIERIAILSSDFIAKLKISWNNNGKSNLDIP